MVQSGDSPKEEDGTFTWTRLSTVSGWRRTEELLNPVAGNTTHIWLRAPLPDFPEQAAWLKLPPVLQSFEVYLDSVRVYQYGMMEPSYSLKYGSTTPHLIPLKDLKAGSMLYLRVFSDLSGNIGLLGAPEIGAGPRVYRHVIRTELYPLVIAGLFFIAGLVALLIAIRRRRMEFASLSFSFGVFALSVGFILLSSLLTVRAAIPSDGFWYFANAFAFLVFPVGLFSFFERLVKGEYRRFVRYAWIAHLGLAAVAILLDVTGVLISMYLRPVFFVLLTATTVASMYIAVVEWRTDTSGVRVFLAGMLALAVCGLHDIYYHGFGVDLAEPQWFMTGALILLFCLGYILENGFAESLEELRRTHEQLEAYSKTLEDKVEDRVAELNVKNDELEAALHQLNEAQGYMVQAAKMSSLGQLTAGIAHELKNPLNFVNNFAEVSISLAEELEEDIVDAGDKPVSEVASEFREILDDIRLNASKISSYGKRADGIIRGMMSHATGKAGNMDSIHLHQMLKEYVQLAHHGMQARHEDFEAALIFDFDERIKEVDLVAPEMGRVIVNLTENALYAVHEAWQNFEKEGIPFRPSIWVSTHLNDDTVEFRIRDNGGGVVVEDADQVFEPFFTTKPPGSSIGLGLSLSYDIISSGHNGQLTLENAPGDGATFVVRIPLKQEIEESLPEAE